jgi:hypothetical protein
MIRTGKNGNLFFGPGALFLVPLLFLLSCGGGGSSPSPPPLSPNQLLVSLLPGFLNTPVVSLTVCVPGTTTCQTIDSILLDTGSVGLRLAHGAVSIPLPQVTDNGYVYECMQFGTFDNFGPVVTADVTLGSEPTIHSLTVQISNSNLSIPSGCSPIAPFSQSGINGILGVGYPFLQFDGQLYYACPSTSGCSSSPTLSCSNNTTGIPPCLVSNPVFSLPTDNNGVLVSIPSVPSAGSGNVSGTLTFGIETQSDNSMSGLTRYTVGTAANSCSDSYYLSATFNGSSGTSCAFLDTGSNGIFFGTTTFPLCPSSGPYKDQWYCPSPSPSPASIFFSPTGANGATGNYNLSVLSYDVIAQSTNIAWNDLAGPYGSNLTFDAGLPFFFGRTVAIGFQTGGQTPFWAF